MSADAELADEDSEKTTVVTVCLGGCSGCHMEFLNIDYGLVDMLEDVEIKASHMIVDGEGVPEADIGIAEGFVTNEENVEVARELRENCDTVVAWGDCAALRGIMSLRNHDDRDETLEEIYVDQADDESEVPYGDGDGVPKLLENGKPLDAFIDVDVYIPGCPPDAEIMRYGIEALANGERPEIVDDKLQYD